MTKPTEPRPIERRTVFVLAGILLSAIVSIAFFNLDRHPAFLLPSEEFVAEVDDAESALIVADDPVALAALEQHGSSLDASFVPLTHWPPETSLFSFGSAKAKYERADFEQVAAESVWSLWQPAEKTYLPLFQTATVETETPDGRQRTCAPDTTGAHQCGDASWSRVGPREISVAGTSTECIWAHPMDGKTLRILFDNVTTTGPDGQPLRFDTALSDGAVGTGVPVDFEIDVDGQTVFHRHRDRRGWQSIRLPATDSADRLEVEISADDVGRRHTCFRFDFR